MRPASESANPGTISTLAEPVSTKRPGLRSRSMDSLIAANNSGTLCTSSSTTLSGMSATKPAGSAREALRAASSSKVM